MDLLKTILLYMTVLFTASVQSAELPDELPSLATAAPTAYVETAADSPFSNLAPAATPVPTIAITPNPAYKVLRMGDSGEDVRQLQEKLAEYGYLTGDIDGRYGNQTRRAVMVFQTQHGLSADGVAGPSTLTVLLESEEVRLAPGLEPTPSPTPANVLSFASATPVPEVKTVHFVSTDSENLKEETDTLPEVPAETSAPETEDSNAEKPSDDKPVSDVPEIKDLQSKDNKDQREFMPIQTPVPEENRGFIPVENIRIYLAEETEPMTLSEDASTPLRLYSLGDEFYVPIVEILENASVYVISEVSEANEQFAFVVGNTIYRISFTEDLDGEPVDLKAYMNQKLQTLIDGDIRRENGILYMPEHCIQTFTGISFEIDQAAGKCVVIIPED